MNKLTDGQMRDSDKMKEMCDELFDPEPSPTLAILYALGKEISGEEARTQLREMNIHWLEQIDTMMPLVHYIANRG